MQGWINQTIKSSFIRKKINNKLKLKHGNNNRGTKNVNGILMKMFRKLKNPTFWILFVVTIGSLLEGVDMGEKYILGVNSEI